MPSRRPRLPRRWPLRGLVLTAAEVVLAVAAATLGVAALAPSTPAAGLGIIYLLAVLVVAVRRGPAAALVSALLSVLALNFFFIAPRHRLEVRRSQDFVELAVLLIAAVVVARLAAATRHATAAADARAREAEAREHEAELVAQAASAVLAGEGVRSQLDGIARRIAAATGAGTVRIVLGPVPSPAADELLFPLPSRVVRAWLHVSRDVQWDSAQLERIAGPLGRLLDVAVERERVAERAAETEAARRAETARTAILHAISHDLRSPLTAIKTAASALRSAAVDEGERRELAEAIEADATRLATLVGNLLDLSRIEAGAVAPQADWCDLHEIVAAAVVDTGAGDRVEFSLPDGLPLVRADGAQLERVFSNLIENAVKFSPPDSPIEIGGGAGPSWVTVRVSDHGAGIPKAQRAHVFEPFFRGRASGNPGSGLGLAICRGFVEANGGRITVQSRTGAGTSFAVSLPLVRQPAAV